MFAIRGGWGLTGNPVSEEGLMFNKYSTLGNYNGVQGLYPSSLRLVEIRPEKAMDWNIGFNLNFLNDLIMVDFNVYDKKNSDLLMRGVAIPTSTGYPSLSWSNVG